MEPISSTDLGASIAKELGIDHPISTQEYLEMDPELFRRYVEYRGWILEDRALTKRTKILMVVAVMAALKHEEALRRYISAAKVSGASREEILDACRVGILFAGGPGLIAVGEALHGLDE
jgi:alkylhydroperoxidase/carboxymuconolactone decarboxylase family protein YurZ